MRRSVAVIVSVLALAGLLSPSADASRRRTTYVMIDCLHMRTAPTSILFACADGNYYVDHLTWTRWHNWKASGSGLFHKNDCRPSCAEGTFHSAWGRIWLRNPYRCAPHRYAFQHVRVLYVRKLLGDRREAFGHLGCPLHRAGDERVGQPRGHRMLPAII
jgi:hypothetical protein